MQTSIMSHTTLSKREIEILYLIAHEYTSTEIAGKLYISRNTVNSHRKMIFAKLDVRNSAGLIRKSFELGILTVSAKPKLKLDLGTDPYVKALSA